MDFKKYFEEHEFQKKLNWIIKKYKNKRIALYGAGQFANTIFKNYDLSKLNIVAIADMKFENEENRNFYNLNCIAPDELGDFDCDIILISNYDYRLFLKYLDSNILYRKKNAAIAIRPLIN